MNNLYKRDEAYQGHAGNGGLQNHSVGGTYAAGFIIVATNDGYYAQEVKTGKRTGLAAGYDAACELGFAGAYIRDAEPTQCTAGRPSTWGATSHD